VLAVAGLAPEPKIHDQEVIVPVDASVKVNVVDVLPLSGLPLKSATGTLTAKFAVTLFGPLIVRLFGFCVPVKSPDQLVNTYPVLAFAVNWTTAPEVYQGSPSPTGSQFIVPPSGGEAVVVN
jgi:hypothetical protein